MVRGSLRLALLAVTPACQVNDPGINMPAQMRADAPEHVFADTLVAKTVGGTLTSCTDDLPTDCGPVSSGSCQDESALGPEDGSVFTLDGHGGVEVGFRCNWIHLHGLTAGGATIPDLRIVALPGANTIKATVAVSFDGSVFETITPVNATSIGPGETLLSLTTTRTPLEAARFVRISDSTGDGGLQIDAVEAL